MFLNIQYFILSNFFLLLFSCFMCASHIGQSVDSYLEPQGITNHTLAGLGMQGTRQATLCMSVDRLRNEPLLYFDQIVWHVALWRLFGRLQGGVPRGIPEVSPQLGLRRARNFCGSMSHWVIELGLVLNQGSKVSTLNCRIRLSSTASCLLRSSV